MRSVTLSLCVAMAATGILGLACSSSDDSPAAGGTAGVGGATGGTGGFEGGVGGVGGVGGTGGGTGGAAGDGNDTKETATPISIGTDPQDDSIQGSLDPVATDQDWYSFDGTAGMVLSILTVGKTGTDKFDPTYPDLVVSIHDESGAQIALQDDPDPRTSNDPYLLTVLPTTGKYFVRIVECNAWEQGGAANCAPAAGVVNKNYAFFLSEVKFDTDSEILEAEPNDTAGNATPITFTPNPNSVGAYYLSLVHGAFSAQTDVDGFSFAIPAGLTVAAGSRAVVNFYPQESGMNGNGSSTDMGELTIVEASAPAVVIAQVNVAQGGRFSVPLTVGTDYVAFYKRAATPSGAQDFYFDFVGVGSGNPLEQAEATNDDLATAEVIPVSATQAGSYFIEGDLVGSDVDHFSVAVPAANADVVSVACGAERSGSGVRGLVATLLDDAGSPVTGGTATESATTDLRITDLAVPAGKTTLVLKLEPTSQAPEVMSTFYRCGVHFRATPTN